MAKPAKTARSKAASAPARARLAPGRKDMARWAIRGGIGLVAVLLAAVLFFSLFNPPTTIYMAAESRRLGGVEQEWVDFENVAPVMARSIVAAEDANFCLHWGFDMGEIRRAIDAGGQRGASTISQQTVKNVYLWQGRSWPRKALEAVLTPLVETFWSKRRILEVYMNVAEFGEGVFGVQAAAQHYYNVDAARLTPPQAARLAAILPDPKGRDPRRPTAFVQRRGAAIQDGAQTIRADGRANCFTG